MSCGLDKDKLTGYFDGELDAAERAEVERHIGVCSECLRELEEVKSASLTIRGLPRYAVPPAVTEAVLREVSRGVAEVAVFRPKSRWLPWALTAAAAVFVAVNVVYFTSLPRRTDPSPPATDIAVRTGSSEEPKKALPDAKLEAQKNRESFAMSKGGEDRPADKPAAPSRKQVPPFYSVISSDIADARARVEETLRDMGVAYSTGAGEFDQSAYAKDTCIEVEATDNQLLALGGRLSSEKVWWREGAAEYRRSDRERLLERKAFADLESAGTGGGTTPGKKDKAANDPREPEADRTATREGTKEEDKAKSPGPAAEKAEKKVRAVIFFHELQKPRPGK